jgi:hypothetical protein
MQRLSIFALICLAAGGCAPAADEGNSRGNSVAAPATPQAEAPLPPVEPIPPGQLGGLPDDRTPVSEAPFTPTSAQGAANVVQTWFALLESGRASDGKSAWRDPAAADSFVKSLGDPREVHAQIGAPGEIEGAAGSSFVEVPVQVYGRARDGAPFSSLGTATLRRVNDVPGSTPDQRSWHIDSIAVRPAA